MSSRGGRKRKGKGKRQGRTDAPACPYCERTARLVNGHAIYPQAGPWLGRKPFWLCSGCNAYVGCHPGTTRPLGRLANAELRRWKIEAHKAFDPLWKSGGMTRREAYHWLAGQLDIPGRQCHIGMFDEATCRRVVELVAQRDTEADRLPIDEMREVG